MGIRQKRTIRLQNREKRFSLKPFLSTTTAAIAATATTTIACSANRTTTDVCVCKQHENEL